MPQRADTNDARDDARLRYYMLLACWVAWVLGCAPLLHIRHKTQSEEVLKHAPDVRPMNKQDTTCGCPPLSHQRQHRATYGRIYRHRYTSHISRTHFHVRSCARARSKTQCSAVRACRQCVCLCDRWHLYTRSLSLSLSLPLPKNPERKGNRENI